MFWKSEDPFGLLPHCVSLSILPFDFSSSLLLSLWSIKQPGFQTPIRWLFWGASLPSSWSAGSLIKVSSLPQHLVSQVHWPFMRQAEWTWTWWHKHLILVFSFCFQSFPATGSFPVRHLFTPGDQSIGASASASVHLMNMQSWFPLRLTSLISLQSKGL